MRYQAENTTWLCSELVTLVYQHGFERRAVTANLEQISPSSAVLLIDAPIGNFSDIVAFIAQGHELRGRVTGIEQDRLLGSLLTIELDVSTRWTPEWFTPEHALRVDRRQAVAASAA
ncbi:MAG TPA: hypothetical protein VFA04_27340 [Bryobacteraceae bacterium]|nr:hypothetical protein [Bryobacteraceae bacterium]